MVLPEMFRLSVPLSEIVIRGTVMFLVLYVLMRIVGKREAGAHSLTDLLVVVLVASGAAHGMSGAAHSIADSVVLVATILFWSIALDALAYRWPRLGRLLKARATPLVRDGKINQRALRRELMNREELMTELRLHGISDVREVARAYLEPNGMVSIIRTTGDDPEPPPTRPVTG